MNTKKLGIGAAALAAAAAFAVGGVAITNANAATTPAATTYASDTTTPPGAQGQGDQQGQRGPKGQAGAPGAQGARGQSQDTPVTGDEAAKVSAAVTAKDSTVKVDSVRKDPDGSYDVLGTKDGNPVMFDVSADLATVTQAQGGPGGGGHGGPGGHAGGPGASQDTPVTGDEAAKVSAAVTAKDSTVKVDSVRKDPDGSYDVLGTKDGNPVMFDVSADLATVTQAQGGPGGGGHGGPGGHGGRDGAPQGTGQQAPQTAPSPTSGS